MFYLAQAVIVFAFGLVTFYFTETPLSKQAKLFLVIFLSAVVASTDSAISYCWFAGLIAADAFIGAIKGDK